MLIHIKGAMCKNCRWKHLFLNGLWLSTEGEEITALTVRCCTKMLHNTINSRQKPPNQNIWPFLVNVAMQAAQSNKTQQRNDHNHFWHMLCWICMISDIVSSGNMRWKLIGKEKEKMSLSLNEKRSHFPVWIHCYILQPPSVCFTCCLMVDLCPQYDVSVWYVREQECHVSHRESTTPAGW